MKQGNKRACGLYIIDMQLQSRRVRMHVLIKWILQITPFNRYTILWYNNDTNYNKKKSLMK